MVSRRTDGLEVSIAGPVRIRSHALGASDPLPDVGGLIHSFGALVGLGTSATGATTSDWALYDAGGSLENPDRAVERAWVAAGIPDRQTDHMIVRAAQLLAAAIDSVAVLELTELSVAVPDGTVSRVHPTDRAAGREILRLHSHSVSDRFAISVDVAATPHPDQRRLQQLADVLESDGAGSDFRVESAASESSIRFAAQVWTSVTAAWIAALLTDQLVADCNAVSVTISAAGA